MQQSASYSNQLIHKHTLDLGQYNILRYDLVPWLSLIKIENQNTHRTPQQLLELIRQIPEIRVINTVILPNWIICSAHDVDFALYGLICNPIFIQPLPLGQKYKWIDASGIIVHHQKVKPKLHDIIYELCKLGDYVIYQPHSFTTITEFWEWIASCPSLTDTNLQQIIFMKPSEAKTYRTASAGVIPLDIARLQNEFFATNPGVALGSPALRNNILSNKSITHRISDKDPTLTASQPILIQDLDKLRIQLLAYQLASPDELAIETGAILGKIQEIRNCIGIHKIE